jgi:hypothetical protein
MKMPMKRRVEAAALPFTDVVGLQTNKARALIAGEHQATRAVVNLSDKATGVSADNTRAGHHSNASGISGHAEAFNSLSSSLPDWSRFGAGNERPTF